MKAKIEIDVPEFQIGNEVNVYFKDSMCKKGICEKDNQNITLDDFERFAIEHDYAIMTTEIYSKAIKALEGCKWIMVDNHLPYVRYDISGNWNSDDVLICFADGHIEIAHFNPNSVFEISDNGEISTVGSPLSQDDDKKVIAWMPLPEPYEPNED